MKKLIYLKNVSLAYDQPVLNNIEFKLSAGQVVAVGGEAGSGKGTFLKVAAGLVEADEGDLFLFGNNFWKLPRWEMNKIRRKTSFFFREGALLANMNIYDNLALPLRYNELLEADEVEERIVPLLKKLQLLKYRQQSPASLTLKLKLRVALARALIIKSPEIYFWNGAEDLGLESKKLVEEVIGEAKKKGVSSLITGNSEWTKSIADVGFKLIAGSLKPW